MLSKEYIEKLKKNYMEDKFNITRRRMLNKVSITELITDIDTNISNDFNINIKTHRVIDQENSARCWSFAALNILREKVIEKCNLDNFELSGSYVAYYDKLERFNVSLEKLIAYKQRYKGLYDLDVSLLLQSGIDDEGNFNQFANIVNKYGIVPKSVFPESFPSSNTYEINQILSRLLRKFYLDLEKTKDVLELKNKYLEMSYLIISNMYGLPPEVFNFEYTDKDGVYHIDKNITPREFYDKYINLDLIKDYIEVASYQDNAIKYNHIYEIEDSAKLSETRNDIILNIPPDSFQNLLLKQITNLEPIYFYCSTTFKRVDGIWLDIMARYGDVFGIDLTMNQNEVMQTNGVTNCHCMLITGVNIVDNEITKWKIENSWGEKYGNQGYYIATNDYICKYVHMAVINKIHLTEQEHNILKQKTIKLDRWNSKFQN